MSRFDLRGCAVSGATPVALEAWERALAAAGSWRIADDAPLGLALHEAPAFVMAHIAKAWSLVGGRDPRRARFAEPIVAQALALPSNERERLHLAALRAALSDDFEGAKRWLGRALETYPRDAVALQVAHGFDYVTGDVAAMGARLRKVLPAWTKDMPGHHAVLAMHAFALEEDGDCAQAEDVAAAALEEHPGDARACHVMAHVFEMTDRPAAGVRWMAERAGTWATKSIVATHGWWHVGLFHLSQGEIARALALHDEHIRGGRTGDVADMIDASALLWRVELLGGFAGDRWNDLAAAWAPRIDDGFCSFNDVHAMLAFVGARDWERARRLEAVLARRRLQRSRHGLTTRQLGLPACRALLAFGRGDDALAVKLLARLPPYAHRLGGSHAQRDVLHLTLQRAVERLRGPRRRTPAVQAGLPLLA